MSNINAAQPKVELRDISKSFIYSRALDNLSMSIYEGEVLAIVGHNGAGKSTLVNILAGTYHPNSGSVIIDGSPTESDYDVYEANRLGIRAVFQELSLCPNLTVAENLRIFHPALGGRGWQKRLGGMFVETMDRIFPGHGIRATDTIESLPLGQRQMVEIAKAFTISELPLKLLILDEPTSALDHHTTQQLIDFILSLRGGSMSVIYISHLLDEVLSCTDRIAVLRDGRNLGILTTKDASRQTVIELMGEAKLLREEKEAGPFSHQSSRDKFKDVPLVVKSVVEDGELRITVHEGEIVGLTGLAGHGQTELLLELFDSRSAKQYQVKGAVTFVPGDRQSDGVFPIWSIAKNLTVQVYDVLKRLLLIDQNREKEVAEKWRRSIGIKTDSVRRGILSLSGGNQQKVLFARCLESAAPLVLMDDPTRGVDVGTTHELYKLIMEESRKGRAFVWYTTEMDELKYCDRIYVFKSGKIIAELSGDEATQEDVLKSSF